MRAQLKSEYDYHHLEFIEEKFDPEYLFNTYLQNGLPKAVNLRSDTFAKAAALAPDWDHKDWIDLITNAKSLIASRLEDNGLERMYKSKAFLEYHKAQGGTLEKTANAPEDIAPAGPPKVVQAAKRLGIQNVEALRVYIAAVEKHGLKMVQPVAQKLLQAEGVKLSVDTFNAFLVKGKFAKPRPEVEALGTVAPGLRPEQIQLNKKALLICGFENIKGDKPLGRIRAMIHAIETDDKRAAEVCFARILKEEPRSSFLHNDSVKDLMKRMRQRKAFALPA